MTDTTKPLLDAVTFDANGLCPVIAQEARTGMIRMVAWANREALELTAETKAAHFWSRSRKALWRKGESSGHTLAVREIRLDCDGDVALYLVDAEGPSCHTGATSCFYRRAGDDGAIIEDDGPPDPPALVLARVADVIAERRRTRPEKSYVVSLLDAGLPKINGKIAEESRELIEALARERRRAHRARGGRSDLPHAGRSGGGRRADRRGLRPAAQAVRDLRPRRKSEPPEMIDGSSSSRDAIRSEARRNIRRLLGPGGAAAEVLPGYEARAGQLAMAERIADAIDGDERLLVEAGTGTGKTLAYLVPALLSGRKVVVSTGTKTLQDQIATVDLPRLRTIFAAAGIGDENLDWAVMKGLGNYVCRRRLGRARAAAEPGRRSRLRAPAGLRRVVADRRSRRDRRAGRRGAALERDRRHPRDAHRPPLQLLRELLRDLDAPPGRRRAAGDRQPPPLLRRSGAARALAGGAGAPSLRGGHLRRGPPDRRRGDGVLRRPRLDAAAVRAGPRSRARDRRPARAGAVGFRAPDGGGRGARRRAPQAGPGAARGRRRDARPLPRRPRHRPGARRLPPARRSARGDRRLAESRRQRGGRFAAPGGGGGARPARGRRADRSVGADRRPRTRACPLAGRLAAQRRPARVAGRRRPAAGTRARRLPGADRAHLGDADRRRLVRLPAHARRPRRHGGRGQLPLAVQLRAPGAALPGARSPRAQSGRLRDRRRRAHGRALRRSPAGARCCSSPASRTCASPRPTCAATPTFRSRSWCRGSARATSCWRRCAPGSAPCCWRRRASGRGSTSPARRCRWW